MEEQNVFEIIQINDTTWRIEENGAVRHFLLTGSDFALAIDTGMSGEDTLSRLQTLTDLPIKLLNTHGDPDHVGGNHYFDSFYLHPADTANYLSHHSGGTILPVQEGDIIDLGGRPLEIISLPGHTPGSIAILDINARVLIAGDTLQDEFIFMFGEYRNVDQYISSLPKLDAYMDRFDEIWPSHGPIPIGKDIIGKLLDGAIQLRDGKLSGEKLEIFGHEIIRYDLGGYGFLSEI